MGVVILIMVVAEWVWSGALIIGVGGLVLLINGCGQEH